MKSSTIKRVTLIMSMALVTILTYGQQKGDKAVGGNILYGFDENNIGIAGKYQWNITDAFRLEPSASYYPQKSNIKMWDMNVNLHYLFIAKAHLF